ncbi:hypothetical protein AMATHDRAFT_58314, partial [Amanita thiersii Skay4041]
MRSKEHSSNGPKRLSKTLTHARVAAELRFHHSNNSRCKAPSYTIRAFAELMELEEEYGSEAFPVSEIQSRIELRVRCLGHPVRCHSQAMMEAIKNIIHFGYLQQGSDAATVTFTLLGQKFIKQLLEHEYNLVTHPEMQDAFETRCSFIRLNTKPSNKVTSKEWEYETLATRRENEEIRKAREGPQPPVSGNTSGPSNMTNRAPSPSTVYEDVPMSPISWSSDKETPMQVDLEPNHKDPCNFTPRSPRIITYNAYPTPESLPSACRSAIAVSDDQSPTKNRTRNSGRDQQVMGEDTEQDLDNETQYKAKFNELYAGLQRTNYTLAALHALHSTEGREHMERDEHNEAEIRSLKKTIFERNAEVEALERRL